MSHARLSNLVFAGLAAAALLAGCGSGGSGDEEASRAAARKVAPKPVAPRMAKAASPDDPGVPVAVTFDLRKRPVAGEPFDVLLEITPTAELAEMSARVESGTGLAIQGGSNLPVVQQPAVGAPVQHVVTAVAQQDDVYTLKVLVSGPPGPAGEPARTRTFLVPVIAGAGVAATMPATPEDGTGDAATGPPTASPSDVPRRASAP